MAKFNAPVPSRTAKTTNLAGGPAFKMDKRLDLFSSVCTTFLEDKFYENAKTRMARIAELAAECPPEFVAKLAVWARTEGNLRSAPTYLTALLATLHNGDSLVRRAVAKVVNRADEITEMLSAYQDINGWSKKETRAKSRTFSLSHQLVKGLGDAFNKFDEYQFSKYNRDGRWRLKDALFMCRPVGKDRKQNLLFKKIAEDRLSTAYTHETEMSALGAEMKDASEDEKMEAKAGKWEEMIESGKLGHMACLRNLRNILDTVNDSRTIALAATQIQNPKSVRAGKQFPFRYLSAYEEIMSHKNPYTSLLLDALDSALSVAAENVPGFGPETRVFIANDVSGSMQGTISKYSKIPVQSVGIILGTILRERCKAVQMGVFASTFEAVPTSRKSGIIGNLKDLEQHRFNVGGGTNGAAVIDHLLRHDIEMDKVVIITDCEMWMESGGHGFSRMWDQYHKMFPGAKLYIVNVAGYGTTPIEVHRKDVVYIAGWNEKVFKMMEMLDEGEKIVEMIGQIEI